MEVVNLNTVELTDDMVYVGRPTKWGNPFVSGIHGTKTEVITKYKNHVINSPDLMAALPELYDKTLACWCYPARCHRNVLVELVEANRRDSILTY